MPIQGFSSAYFITTSSIIHPIMIDWNAQWELHAPNFLNGFAHVSLKDFGGSDARFKMAPGPGFGDLSHPTTQIVLTLMPQIIEGPVIDVGCGSGVLSIAAKLSGAPEVMGIDIKREAIKHAKLNAALNNLECSFSKKLLQTPKNPLILMNMISSEQSIAWNSFPDFHGSTLIVSGLPVEEADPSHYGKIIEKLELDGWKGFVIHLYSHNC